MSRRAQHRSSSVLALAGVRAPALALALVTGLGLALLAALGDVPPAAASSLRAIRVEELLQEAELVFEGRVLGLEVEDTGPRRIRTCARFEVIDVLKAPASGVPSPLRLCFAGGQGRSGMRRVEGVVIPQPGEHGVYFVESLTEPLVNPLLGWDQGRFRIVTDPDDPEGRVTSADGREVIGVDDGRGEPPGLSRGVAQGVRVSDEPSVGGAAERRGAARRALSPALFKQRLRTLLPAER